MEPRVDYVESQLRKLMTILFVERARRHLRSLSILYGWTPTQLAEAETRFICVANFVPVFVEREVGELRIEV